LVDSVDILFKVITFYNIDVHWTHWHCHDRGLYTGVLF